MKKKLRETCAECGSINVVYKRDADQLICKDCGAIFEELTEKDEAEYEDVLDDDVPV